MYDFNKLFWLFPQKLIDQKLRNNEARKALFDEMWYVNITRLKSLLHIIALFVLVLLFFDLFSEEIWDKKIQYRYLILDSFMFVYIFSVLAYYRINSPFTLGKINKTNIFLFKLTLFVSIIWTALVSVSEIESSNGLPSFLVGCFALGAIFIISRWLMLLVLATGMITLLIGAFFIAPHMGNALAAYFPSFFLTVVSYFISRVLYTNYIKTFAANYELNLTNTHLDELVKKRTLELSEINEKLENEISLSYKYEAKLRLEKLKAEEADRLKSAFLANMSHEIRTPLNGIVGFSDLLGRKHIDEEKRNRYLSIIKSNSNQLIQIIDDIIDISMIESNQLKYKYEEIYVKQIFEKSIHLYDGPDIINEDKIEFITELFDIDDNLSICSDINRIRQVIYNLIGNAFKFTKQGYVKFTMRKDENDLFVYVEDTGIGISQEKANIIFERFRQIEDTPYQRFGGTGLGLSISKAIIQHLNGDIWLDSYYKNGARFCFSIPITHNIPKPLDNFDVLHIKTTTTRNKKILIFIEDIDFLNYIRQLFNTERVVLCNKYSKALRDLTSNHFDLVIFGNHENNLNLDQLGKIKELISDNTVLYSIVKNAGHFKHITALGCSKVYQVPLNLFKFISDIKVALEQQDAGKITLAKQ